MTQLSDDKLLSYNSQGLIPGPDEEETAFIERVEYCLNLREKLAGNLPFGVEAEAPATVLGEALQKTAALYDITPAWVPVFFSNYQLTPWHGGCAWIFQMSATEPTAAFFQLRQAFRNSKAYLGIYDREELMAHELVHVARMMYEEPQFEELLAYRTSKNRFRRWWGPLVQSSSESVWFVCLLMPIIFFDLYFIFSDNSAWYWKMMWLKLLPLCLIAAAALRLYKRQSSFQKALHNLSTLVKDPQKAQALLLRLTDYEIQLFAKSTLEQISSYISTQQSLRWRLILLAYPI